MRYIVLVVTLFFLTSCTCLNFERETFECEKKRFVSNFTGDKSLKELLKFPFYYKKSYGMWNKEKERFLDNFWGKRCTDNTGISYDPYEKYRTKYYFKNKYIETLKPYIFKDIK